MMALYEYLIFSLMQCPPNILTPGRQPPPALRAHTDRIAPMAAVMTARQRFTGGIAGKRMVLPQQDLTIIKKIILKLKKIVL